MQPASLCRWPLGWSLVLVCCGPLAARQNVDPPPTDASPPDARVAGLVESLSSEDAASRRRAAAQLAGLGERSAAAIPALIGLLVDQEAPPLDSVARVDGPVSAAARKALAAIGPPALPPLVAVLRDPAADEPLRAGCALALGEMGGQGAIDALIAELASDSAAVRSAVATSLRQIGEPALASLVPLMKHENSLVRSGATQGISEVRTEQVTDLLIQALDDPDYEVRYFAVQALGKKGFDKKLADAILTVADDPHERVRAEAIAALAPFNDERVVPILLKGLSDTYQVARWRAAAQLGQKRVAAAVEPLLAALKSDDASMRVYSATALGAIGDRRAVNGLILLQRSDPLQRVRDAAARAIEALGGEPPAPPEI